MPNILDATGLTVMTRAELVTYFTTQYQLIYGDITLASDTPDGQMMNIYIQSVLDLQDLVVQIYNSFDPDNAIGVVLDQRVSINGIQRQAGTYTVTPITLVNSASVNLTGLDADGVVQTDTYTISDNAGNLWVLMETELGLAAGTHVLSFRAAVPGAQLTIPNTITVPVTIILGVTSVNNPTTYTTLGVNEETDAQLRVRRQRSVSLASQGYLAGLLAALENVDGVTSAFIYENITGVTNVDGVPGHSIWAIVSGTGAPADIAQAIYTKRNAGCGMFGDESYVITQVDGSPFTVYWDDVVTRELFIAFTATSINGVQPPNIETIRAGLVTSLAPSVNATVNINELATLVQDIDPNTLVTGAGFSLSETQIATLSDTAASGTFKVSYNGHDSALINWNDVIAVIQTKVQAITGLANALVTGSISSHTLTFDLSLVGGVLGLITVNTNTLATGGAVAITFAFNEGYTNTLTPTAKKNQFVIEAANIIILPMILTPLTSSVGVGGTVDFVGLGGYGTYVYSILTNNSGATINASTGVYTAGTTPSVTDTVEATDTFGNTTTATVSVT